MKRSFREIMRKKKRNSDDGISIFFLHYREQYRPNLRHVISRDAMATVDVN